MKWIIFTSIVVIVFGVIIIIKGSEEQFKGDPNKIITATEEELGDQVEGSKKQKVVLVEYGDFQCPACKNIHPVIKDLVEQNKDKLTFVFRNMPLTNTHPNALAAATAAEAAGLQGKFWEMHDVLYNEQDSWQGASIDQRSAVLEGYANSLGLNIEQYKKDLSDPRISAKINRDRSIARVVGVDQTPVFVLNGQKLDPESATDQEKLQQAITDAINAAYPKDKE